MIIVQNPCENPLEVLLSWWTFQGSKRQGGDVVFRRGGGVVAGAKVVGAIGGLALVRLSVREAICKRLCLSASWISTFPSFPFHPHSHFHSPSLNYANSALIFMNYLLGCATHSGNIIKRTK